MIYTVTFNSSIDYIMNVDNLKVGEINRSTNETVYPGGKGINFSIVLKNLGFESIALGFISGFSGFEIERKLKEFGCKSDFIELSEGISRINVKIHSDCETAVNAQGPIILDKDINKLYNKLDNLKDNDTLVLAGSIPSSLPSNIYEEIMKLLKDKNIRTVVDATNDLLINVLKYRPFLIKPNNFELGEIFNKELTNDKEIIECGKKMQQMGARNVLVSMAEKGAIMIDENNNIHKTNAPKGKLINSVGAGDSMVAGFLAGYFETNNYDFAFKKGVATGSASAFKNWLANKEDVEIIMQIIN